ITDNRQYQVAGVVGDTRFLISRPPETIMYFPMSSGDLNGAALVVRSRQDVTQLALPIQKLVYQLDAELPVSDILTIDQIVGKSTVDARFNSAVLLGFSVLSLVLAGVGLFGVLSYLVTLRTTEIGIRIALGAGREEV